MRMHSPQNIKILPRRWEEIRTEMKMMLRKEKEKTTKRVFGHKLDLDVTSQAKLLEM